MAAAGCWQIGRLDNASELKITIDTIADFANVAGCAGIPGTTVQFRSAAGRGRARFVPASGAPSHWMGAEFTVEIDQGCVSDFRLLARLERPGMEATGEDACFRVRGVVHAVVDGTDTAKDRILYIAAGDAIFTLTSADTGGCPPNEGAFVEFIAHDVCLWDAGI